MTTTPAGTDSQARAEALATTMWQREDGDLYEWDAYVLGYVAGRKEALDDVLKLPRQDTEMTIDEDGHVDVHTAMYRISDIEALRR